MEKLCNKDIYVVEPDVALVTRDGKLVGIFTLTDAFKRYADMLSREKPGG